MVTTARRNTTASDLVAPGCAHSDAIQMSPCQYICRAMNGSSNPLATRKPRATPWLLSVSAIAATKVAAHEAVAEDVDGIQERVERHEQKLLHARRATGRQPGHDPGELHEVVDADEHGVHRGERHRAWLQIFRSGGASSWMPSIRSKNEGPRNRFSRGACRE